MPNTLSPDPPALRSPTRLLLALLAADLVLAWLGIVGSLLFVERLFQGLAGYAIQEAGLARHVAQMQWLWGIQALGWLATGSAFLGWLHGAYARLAWLGTGRRGYTPRWAVGGFLVPLLNLVHPVHILAEIWQASAAPPAGDEAPGRARVPAWLVAWWALLLLACALDPPPLRPFAAADLRLGPGADLPRLVLAALAEMGAAILAIFLVWRVSTGQDERLARAGAPPAR